MKNIEWHRNAGVELTRLRPWELTSHVPEHIKEAAEKFFPKVKGKHPDGQSKYDYNHNLYIEVMYKNPAEFHHNTLWDAIVPKFELDNQHIINVFGIDLGCVEVSSAILTSWDMLNEFYHKVDAICEELGLIRWSEEICGTGGHVHIAIDDDVSAQKVLQLMLNHPEAMFAFCNPSDSYHGLQNANIRTTNVYTMHHAVEKKSGPIAYRKCYGTMEFRMFDIAQTWQMQEEHMAFAQRFVEHALKNPVDRKKLLRKDEIIARSVQEHSVNFENLIRMLKLPWRRYRDYVENIELRHQFGTKNFRSS